MTSLASCSYQDCNRAVEANGLCVLHCPKATLEEKQQMSQDERQAAEEVEQRCRDEFFCLLEKLENDTQTDTIDFSGFSMPSLNLRDKAFSKHVNFNHTTFSGQTDFDRASFNGQASFNRASFNGQV
jgi:hypothetical protein